MFHGIFIKHMIDLPYLDFENPMSAAFRREAEVRWRELGDRNMREIIHENKDKNKRQKIK